MRCLKGFVIVQILRCVTIIRKGLLPFCFLQNSTGNICALVCFLQKQENALQVPKIRNSKGSMPRVGIKRMRSQSLPLRERGERHPQTFARNAPHETSIFLRLVSHFARELSPQRI
jgi:hypothetical protein